MVLRITRDQLDIAETSTLPDREIYRILKIALTELKTKKLECEGYQNVIARVKTLLDRQNQINNHFEECK